MILSRFMKSLFHVQPLTLAISACLLAQASYAETENNPIEVKQLPLIVVTAQQEHNANGLMVVADPKQPIQPMPASDGSAYLKSIMGFSGTQSGGTNGDVSFRGMFGSRVKILTDGTENLGACPSRMDAPTSYISPESFDKITVVKGPQTVEYAHTGSAATVIFSRATPSFTEQPYQGQASVVAGSFGRVDHNIDTAIGNDEVYARLNATRSKSNNYKDGDGRSVPSSWEKWSSDVALGWTPNSDTQVELSAGKSDGEALYAGRGMDGSKFARESIGLSYKQENISPLLKQLEAQVDYNFNDHVMDNFSLRPFTPTGGMNMPMAHNVSRKTLNARIANIIELNDKVQIKSGVDQQYNEHAGRMGSKMNSYTNQPRIKDMEFQSYGAFAEVSTAISPQQQFIVGARADDIKVKDLRADSQHHGKNPERHKTLASGFFRLENENPQHNLGSYIGIGYVERMPDYWELFSAGDNSNFSTLKPEKTTQLDIGMQLEKERFNLSGSAYVGYIQDFVLIDYREKKHDMDHGAGGHGMGHDANGDHNMNHDMGHGANDHNMDHGHKHGPSNQANNVNALIAGAELGLSYDLTEQIIADANLAYAWGKNRTDKTALPQIAPLEGRFNLKYVQDDYSFGASLRAVAKQKRIAEQQGNITGYDIAPSKAFATLALNANYRLNQSVDFSLGVDNLFDKTYAEHLNKLGNAGFGYSGTEQFNSIGRNYWARIGMKF